MEIVKAWFKDFFSDKGTAVANLLIGVCAGLFVYLEWLQRHFFSKTYLAYAFLVAAGVTLLAAWLRKRWLRSKFHSLSRKMRWFAVISTLLLTLILLSNTIFTIEPLYYLLPESQLKIRIPIGDVPEGQESVRLLWVETGQGDVYYDHLLYEGEWERVEKNIVFAPNQEVTITWEGKAGYMPEVGFRMTPYDQPVFISWNGVEAEYNLSLPDAGEEIQPVEDAPSPFDEPVTILREALLPEKGSTVPAGYNILIQTPLELSQLYKLPFILSYIIVVGSLISSLLLFLGAGKSTGRSGVGSSKYTWLFYMLPMLLVWGFSLLVFWPGIMSADSVTLWSQSLDGQFSDWGSAFNGLMLAGLMRVWYSPALVAILQILLMAFLVAWGNRSLEENGVPKLCLWTVSILFAVLPINNLFVITLWRDIPYALAFFWLMLIVLKIFLSKGEWVRGLGWVWLALSGFLIAIYRQNGIPVAIGIMVLLPLVYPKYWKRLAGSLLLFLAIFLFMKGPVFTWVKVERSNEGHFNLILAHHIAAHLNAGTELEDSEKEYLDSFQPTEDWFYYCCYVGTISYDENFDRERFLASSTENRKLALDLFLRDPQVDLEHMLCSSEVVWRYWDNQCYMKSSHGFNSWKPGETSWIVPNNAGLHDDSRIPDLVQPYVDTLRIFGFRDDHLVFYLRPAFYLYLSIFCTFALILRKKDLRASLIIMPLLMQAGILFLINYAPAIRYQYSNYIVGLYSLGLIFLPRIQSEE